MDYYKAEHEIIKNLQGLEKEIAANIKKKNPHSSLWKLEKIYQSKLEEYFSKQNKTGHSLEMAVLECKEEQYCFKTKKTGVEDQS